MSRKPKNPFRDTIYGSMKLKDTEELLDIWKQNDRERWAEVSFEVIRDILMERLGSVPDQGIGEEAEKEELMEEEPGTYHDPDVFVRLSALARSVAWVVLVASVVIWLAQVAAIISSVTNSPFPDAGLAEIVMPLLSTGFTLISGVFALYSTTVCVGNGLCPYGH